MDRGFNLGDVIICTESGVRGIAIRFYTPMSCEEQTLVETDDGRQYHAPTKTWRPDPHECFARPPNAAETYAYKFAATHRLTINQAMEHPMVRARFDVFEATGW